MWTSTVKDIKRIVKQRDELLTINKDATIEEAATKMRDGKVGCLVVFDDGEKLCGVLSERDVLVKVMAAFLSPDKVFVKDIMTSGAISCDQNSSVEKVEQLMAENKIRHIPVLEKGVPVDMISSRDVIAYQLYCNEKKRNAAEQLAMLSTGLKTLDFNDVIELAINEVPKNFGAERAVLCFAQNDSEELTIYRKDCSLSKERLLNLNNAKEVSQNKQVVCNELCDECQKLNDQTSSLIIPFTVNDHCNDQGSSNISMEGFLCMCGFDSYSAGLEELQMYKASLLQEILNANLTSAKLYQSYQEALRNSRIDPLTGVGTRRVLEETLNSEYARGLRYNSGFSIAIIDVDNLKGINDTAGHQAGDKVLRQLAKTMRYNLRTMDVVARYGGDEFMLLLPETKLDEAKALLERLKTQATNSSISNTPSVTISCGIAQWNQTPDDTPENILKRADNALYKAKRKGRNCVAVATTN